MGALNSLGYAAQELGDISSALAWNQECLLISTELKDIIIIGMCLNNIGRAYKMLFQYDVALEYYEKSLEILMHPPARFWILNDIGDLYFALGKNELALDYFYQGYAIAETLQSNAEFIKLLMKIGKVNRIIHKFDASREFLEKCLYLARENKYGIPESEALGELGLLNEAQGNRNGALKYLRECVALSENILPRVHEQWKKELERVEKTE